jgi:tellurite resistance protein
MSLPHAPLPEDTAAAVGAGAVQLDLLRIVAAVAWCDGEFSDDEQRLLTDLVARYLSPSDGEGPSAQAVEVIASRSASLELLDSLPRQLESAEDRQLAVKLAYMMMRVSRRSGDSADINPREKQAYRRLVEAAGLDPSEVEATEWAAEAELRQLSGGLAGLLRRAFGGLGPWPEASLLQQPGAPRL